MDEKTALGQRVLERWGMIRLLGVGVSWMVVEEGDDDEDDDEMDSDCLRRFEIELARNMEE